MKGSLKNGWDSLIGLHGHLYLLRQILFCGFLAYIWHVRKLWVKPLSHRKGEQIDIGLGEREASVIKARIGMNVWVICTCQYAELMSLDENILAV
ncbi:hypothetical protein LAZ67_23000538 [Cordylochernes scorpioides]|uniref:Uncharacterized protein n=1 Tax=Cordylochernes scorpioides TaxID=51811 RepID=A0ABY6LSL5_9ARAC|nr:hypothetical protein LAZ67_23000538 [Cordylochernes scorpioides]